MRCERCNRLCQDNPASVPRLTEVTIKGRRAVFCDDCGRSVSAIHEISDPQVVAEIERPRDSVWVHKGGGYYENKETGETRRGQPSEDEEASGESTHDAAASAEVTPSDEGSVFAPNEGGTGEPLETAESVTQEEPAASGE